MVDLIQRLVKLVIGYGAVQWAGPLLSLIFTPIITRAVQPGEYGTAEYLLTIFSAISTVALLALPQAVNTHFNDRPEDLDWQRQVVGSAFALTVAAGLLAGIALILGAPALAHQSSELTSYTWLLRLGGGLMVFGMSAIVLTSAAQTALRVRWGALFSLTSILATVAGNILFIVVLRLGTVGILFTPMASGLSLFIAAVVLTRPLIGRPRLAVIRLLLTSGLILLPTMGATWILQLSDRLFLGQLVSPTELGYYTIANKLASLVNVVLAPIYSAWMPLALAMQHLPGALERYISMSRYLIAAILAAGLAIGLFAIEILILLTQPEYFPAAPYVGFLTYMHILGGFGAILNTGALMGKQLTSISSAVVAGAAINVCLNALLIPHYGIAGATPATILGYALPQILLYALLQRRYPIAYPIKRILAALGVQLILLLLGLLIPPVAFPLRVTLKLGALIVLLAAYLGLGLILPAELARFFVLTRREIYKRIAKRSA